MRLFYAHLVNLVPEIGGCVAQRSTTPRSIPFPAYLLIPGDNHQLPE